jgi:NADP-dependent 3-hydroxy acid dehydrogenase YdfG
VNNAGEGVFRKVGEMSAEDWHRNIDLNLNGVFYCTREALPRLIARGGGFIVNISSLAAKNAFSGGAGYKAATASASAPSCRAAWIPNSPATRPSGGATPPG